jgi:4-aminobutyrate aminotransferase-like enzyme/Ser/Thr protein kinase RdoA (MazF antagonist)
MTPVDVGRSIAGTAAAAALSAADAERIAESVFGLRGSARRLDGEYDDNFRIDMADGAGYVLKIAPANQDRALIELQVAALDHVRRQAANVGVPHPHRTVDGGLLARVDVGGTRRIGRVLRFIPGVLLAEVKPQGAALLRSLGSTLASLDRALVDFDHPAAHRELQWDLRRAGELRADVAMIADPARRELVTRIIDRVELEVLPVLPGLRASVIHGDGNDYNVVVENDRVVGLIDFGDMLHSTTICELAIASAYVMLGKNDPLGSAAHVVAGYESELPLTDTERRVLYPLMLTRLVMSVIISAARKARAPDNAYYTVHEAPAWAALEALRVLPWDVAGNVLTSASAGGPSVAALRSRRSASLGGNLSLSYERPLNIVRGWKQYLFDADGTEYLDAYNNVAHVGHAHPRVVEAIARQAAVLNTNTRYLHHLIAEYAERLTALLPAPLRVCYFVNSGSEANELALRMARAHTRQRDVIVSAGAYHGNTQTLIDVSPYKYSGPGGAGREPWVHEVPIPDIYRGEFKASERGAGAKYAAHVTEAVERARAQGRGISAFLFESLPSVGGQIIPPSGYLETAYKVVRAAGGVCIADEVQVGLGRVGSHMWGFELQDVVPDIVVCGKPIGNGHPLGAVITTSDIAASFSNGMEYFNTFGGNPVSMAVGLAVLDVLEEERLPEHALRVGNQLLELLHPLKERHALVGDVRGAGLFIGVELVRDRTTLEPADKEASAVVNALRERGILTGTDGPYHNVIKIRPPMPFDSGNAVRVAEALDEVLRSRGAA